VRIEVRFKDNVAVVSLSGRFLAGGDGPFLRQKVAELIEAGARKLILNFGDVPYIDSTGLGFLAGARVTVQHAGARMVLSDVNPHVRRILDDVRLTQFFVIAENELAALQELEKAPPTEAAEPKAPREPKPKKRPAAPPDA
jgi:anti-sigma B factor antagonist